MKILIVSQFYYPEPFRVNEIAEGLVARGHHVVVLTTFPSYPYGATYEGYRNSGKVVEVINGVKVIRVSSIPRKIGLVNLILSYVSFCINACLNLRIVLKEPFDVVYSYQLSPITQVIPAIIASKKIRIPHYLYCLDLWPESVVEVLCEKSLLCKIIHKLSSYIYNCANRIGVTSPSFKDYLCEVCKVKQGNVEYLPQHSDDIMSGQDLTALSDGCVDICFMGNVGASQNIELVVSAVHKLKDVEGFKIHIVGSGSKYNDAVSLCERLHLEDKIVFHGRKPYSQMGEYYKLADVCLLILTNKTFIGSTIPGKLQNYMAAGKPILASIGGDTCGIIEEADCGVYCKPDDEDALVNAILTIVNKQEEFSRWGENSRGYFLQHFTINKHLDRLEHCLEQICKQW